MHISASAFANDVTVYLYNNNKYQVLIDGRNLYNSGYSKRNTFSLPNVSSGQHSIQVIRARNNNGNGRWNNGYANDVVYSNSFSVDPQYDLFTQVDNRGRVTMD